MTQGERRGGKGKEGRPSFAFGEARRSNKVTSRSIRLDDQPELMMDLTDVPASSWTYISEGVLSRVSSVSI
jgi:hypothetical protein